MEYNSQRGTRRVRDMRTGKPEKVSHQIPAAGDYGNTLRKVTIRIPKKRFSGSFSSERLPTGLFGVFPAYNHIVIEKTIRRTCISCNMPGFKRGGNIRIKFPARQVAYRLDLLDYASGQLIWSHIEPANDLSRSRRQQCAGSVRFES